MDLIKAVLMLGLSPHQHFSKFWIPAGVKLGKCDDLGLHLGIKNAVEGLHQLEQLLRRSFVLAND